MRLYVGFTRLGSARRMSIPPIVGRLRAGGGEAPGVRQQAGKLEIAVASLPGNRKGFVVLDADSEEDAFSPASASSLLGRALARSTLSSGSTVVSFETLGKFFAEQARELSIHGSFRSGPHRRTAVLVTPQDRCGRGSIWLDAQPPRPLGLPPRARRAR